MRMVLVFCLMVLLNFGAYAQVPEQKNTKPADSGEPAAAPAGVKTVDELADSVKAPVGPAREQTAAPVDPKTYAIGPEDILRINVWREPEVTAQVQVRPDGRITLNLIGEIEAAGLTPNQLKDRVVEKLSEYMNKPEVNVTVLAVLSRKYFVTGAVARPGRYPLIVPTRVLEAVSNAGGFKEFANLKKISILRDGKTITFNYKDVIKGKNMEQNIFVENGDYINVPE